MEHPRRHGGAASKSGTARRLESRSAPAASQPDIELVDIRPASLGSVVAWVTLRVGELVLYNCKIVEQPGQHPWVALPDRKDEATGKWFPIVSAKPELKKRINETVLAKWREAAR